MNHGSFVVSSLLALLGFALPLSSFSQENPCSYTISGATTSDASIPAFQARLPLHQPNPDEKTGSRLTTKLVRV
jgi:hypothetical protein